MAKKTVVKDVPSLPRATGLVVQVVLQKPAADALRMRAESKSKTVEVYAAEVLEVALAAHI